MIIGALFVSILAVNSELQRFPLHKKSDQDFVAGLVARASKGIRYTIYIYTYRTI